MAAFDKTVKVFGGVPDVSVRVVEGEALCVTLAIDVIDTALYLDEAKAVRKALKRAIKTAEANA